MRRVRISADLERRIRGKKDANELLDEIIEIMDEDKRAATQSAPVEKSGLGYKELVALFRSHLGSALLMPPKPSTPFIIKLVNKAKELGIDHGNVDQIVRGLQLEKGRGPYRIADVIYNADLYYRKGAPTPDSGGGANEDGPLPGRDRRSIYTGRPEE